MRKPNHPHQVSSQDSNEPEEDAEELRALPVVQTPMQTYDNVLLPCPCCGGKADFRHTDVFCTECALHTGMRFRLGIAIKVWNTRVKPNAK
jgi:hypothetical protein